MSIIQFAEAPRRDERTQVSDAEVMRGARSETRLSFKGLYLTAF